MRKLRRFIAIGILLGCAGIFLFLVVTGYFSLNPFAGEFIGLSGAAAKWRLGDDWPPSVGASAVQRVSHKTESSRDSYSSWYKIQLSPVAASQWRDYIHAEQERSSKAWLSDLHEGIEGVHRTFTGTPRLHWLTGKTPAWWSPPAIDFRATEVMKWYRTYDSGVARATYSGFDASTNTLWVYDYAAQHEKLWSPRHVPEGEQFHRARTEPSEAPPR